MDLNTAALRRWVASVLAGSTLCLSSGCATLAHRNSYAYPERQSVVACERKSEVCPWLTGDALLLLPGVLPGVIAFAVDFGTGAWRRDVYAEAASSTDEVAVSSTTEEPR